MLTILIIIEAGIQGGQSAKADVSTDHSWQMAATIWDAPTKNIPAYNKIN